MKVYNAVAESVSKFRRILGLSQGELKERLMHSIENKTSKPTTIASSVISRLETGKSISDNQILYQSIYETMGIDLDQEVVLQEKAEQMAKFIGKYYPDISINEIIECKHSFDILFSLIEQWPSEKISMQNMEMKLLPDLFLLGEFSFTPSLKNASELIMQSTFEANILNYLKNFEIQTNKGGRYLIYLTLNLISIQATKEYKEKKKEEKGKDSTNTKKNTINPSKEYKKNHIKKYLKEGFFDPIIEDFTYIQEKLKDENDIRIFSLKKKFKFIYDSIISSNEIAHKIIGDKIEEWNEIDTIKLRIYYSHIMKSVKAILDLYLVESEEKFEDKQKKYFKHYGNKTENKDNISNELENMLGFTNYPLQLPYYLGGPKEDTEEDSESQSYKDFFESYSKNQLNEEQCDFHLKNIIDYYINSKRYETSKYKILEFAHLIHFENL